MSALDPVEQLLFTLNTGMPVRPTSYAQRWPHVLSPKTYPAYFGTYERFGEIRTRSLRKKPATAELLAWLIVLSASHDEPEVINRLDGPLDALPYLSVLVKDRDDLGQLR